MNLFKSSMNWIIEIPTSGNDNLYLSFKIVNNLYHEQAFIKGFDWILIWFDLYNTADIIKVLRQWT